ncbi:MULTISPECIES: nicotinate-nucleotide adenylyltransferase [Shewanella]|uniref:Probable nicotinate-nucleotide adenylyltransferase n=1 Tax=Shewanella marisflavi TaxID=260364 RepID=A0ABX5WPJ3_9GAMM|nr:MULTISPECIES: nicotinate-nucleotide adenylyltransferase [Shewanella]QDF74484.1 nicotinate-nucleotide adenylyltransferase [Shewanella marisflavi]
MKIGLLGGTFDPIHYGHIKPLLEVQQALGLDEVWLMPNHIPPHKSETRTATRHRLAMAQLVCQQYPQLKLCDIEAKRNTPSYSVDTLNQLRLAHPQDQLVFIMGMDSFVTLPSWYRWQQLLELCHIAVCQRPGWSLADAPQMAQLLGERSADKPALDNATTTEQFSGLIFPVTITPQPYSSTEIRQQLRQHAPAPDAIPQAVIDYIDAHRLYR